VLKRQRHPGLGVPVEYHGIPAYVRPGVCFRFYEVLFRHTDEDLREEDCGVVQSDVGNAERDQAGFLFEGFGDYWEWVFFFGLIAFLFFEGVPRGARRRCRVSDYSLGRLDGGGEFGVESGSRLS
jgi:hypothetical protein